jgi:hypothetical protein
MHCSDLEDQGLATRAELALVRSQMAGECALLRAELACERARIRAEDAREELNRVLATQSRTMVLALFSAMATSSGLAFAAARLV